MEYLVRFSQSHESFRLAEIQALATLENVALEIVSYIPDVRPCSSSSACSAQRGRLRHDRPPPPFSPPPPPKNTDTDPRQSPFCVVRLADDDAATRLVRRSLLAQSIHSLWGMADSLPAFYEDIRSRAAPLWPAYVRASFKLESDSFQGRRSSKARLALIDSFGAVLPLEGDIDMRDPDMVLTVFEHWTFGSVQKKLPDPERYYMGRFVAGTARDASLAFDLKKRRYIATTSMDAELSLLTANLALAAPGKLFYDPFVGTGSFPLAAAHWGATAWGSDIDGRAVRGSAAGINGAGGSGGSRSGRSDVRGNFEQYGLLSAFGDVFTADLTHIPLRIGGTNRWIDGIICDPPYGVREGPRVLGVRNPEKKPWAVEVGKTMYK